MKWSGPFESCRSLAGRLYFNTHKLLQYIYSAQEAGLDAWPPGELRLDGIEVTTNPDLADIFVCPGALLNFRNPSDLDRFPYIEGREERAVFFDVSDYTTIYTRKNPILLRCNLTTSMLAAHPNSLSIAWPVESFSECVDVPDGGHKWDVSFHGWLSGNWDAGLGINHNTRRIASTACLESKDITSDIAQYDDFTGYIYHEPEGIRRRAEFRRSMKESRIALCPESIPGHFPYRFYEAMSAGRVPLLVASDVVFPFADLIPYQDFIIHCPRHQADHAAQIVAEFVACHTDEQIVAMGKMARHYWEKYLDSRLWGKIFTFAVIRKMQALGLTAENAVLALNA